MVRTSIRTKNRKLRPFPRKFLSFFLFSLVHYLQNNKRWTRKIKKDASRRNFLPQALDCQPTNWSWINRFAALRVCGNSQVQACGKGIRNWIHNPGPLSSFIFLLVQRFGPGESNFLSLDTNDRQLFSFIILECRSSVQRKVDS